jgi:nitrite reductase/ring-hydroxylating ferredoxin subunit
VASYRRNVGASLERVWENIHDWEHLPWVHRSSFRAIEHIDSGGWGWRAVVTLPAASDAKDASQEAARASERELLIELVRDGSSDRYVTRMLEGPGAGTEIWTTLTPRDETRTGIAVEFHVLAVAPVHAEAIGSVYTELYRRLWDEDEAMMQHRARELAGRVSVTDPAPLELGDVDALRARVPVVVVFAGRRWRIVSIDGQFEVHGCACPHALGPLDASTVEAGRIRCPWHGYTFDVRTGRSADGRGLRLPEPPRLVTDARTATASMVKNTL